MILVDKMLEKRQQADEPIRVAIVGAGYSGKNIAHQVINSFPAMRLVACQADVSVPPSAVP